MLWYARRITADPAKSIVGISATDATEAETLVGDVPALTGRQKLVLTLFGRTFLIMIYGFIPWNDLWQEGFGKNFPLPTFSDFYFPEAAGLFLVMAVVIGLIARLGEEGTVTTIVAGAADFLGAGADHRARARDHRRDAERLHDRHDPALDGEGGLRLVQRALRDPRLPRQHPDRVPRAVVVGARGARDADPRAARGLRRRLAGDSS